MSPEIRMMKHKKKKARETWAFIILCVIRKKIKCVKKRQCGHVKIIWKKKKTREQFDDKIYEMLYNLY